MHVSVSSVQASKVLVREESVLHILPTGMDIPLSSHVGGAE